MKKEFGQRRDGAMAYLYTIKNEHITAVFSDHGAALINLYVPDAKGNVADVVLGFDTPDQYTDSTTYFGAPVGRNANRVGGASFTMDDMTIRLDANDNGVNNLHSGFKPFKNRLWQVASHTENAIAFTLHSPQGDQGFPGKADIRVTYTLRGKALNIAYDAICDRDTVFNFTNHSYFNLAGHEHPEKAMDQLLTIPGRVFCPDDALNLQGGYDHNWEVASNPCATLTDPVSGRSMCVFTDCPGVQFYAGNYITEQTGKGGVTYCKRSGICLETQYFPNAVNNPEWDQPITLQGEHYHSETVYSFY